MLELEEYEERVPVFTAAKVTEQNIVSALEAIGDEGNGTLQEEDGRKYVELTTTLVMRWRLYVGDYILYIDSNLAGIQDATVFESNFNKKV